MPGLMRRQVEVALAVGPFVTLFRRGLISFFSFCAERAQEGFAGALQLLLEARRAVAVTARPGLRAVLVAAFTAVVRICTRVKSKYCSQ